MKSRFESIVDQFIIFRHGLPEDVLCDKLLSLPLSPLVKQKVCVRKLCHKTYNSLIIQAVKACDLFSEK